MKRAQIFVGFINEFFKYFIGFDEATIQQKEKWADEVWNMLQTSYEAIGGIKGSGFENKESMVHKIPFWKLKTKKGELQYALLYKDSNGRKLVAIGTNGSIDAIATLAKDQEQELRRAFGERSGPALTFTMKSVPFEVLKKYLNTPEQAQKMLGKEVIPLKEFGIKNLNSEDLETFERFKHLLMDYFYVRELGGGWHLKVLFGTRQDVRY